MTETRSRSEQSNRRLPLREDTVGPYYPYMFLDDDRSDLTYVHRGLVAAPRGEQIEIVGRLLDDRGDLVEDAIVELWQANSEGLYSVPGYEADPRYDPYFTGHARLLTRLEPFVFRTIMPGAGEAGPGQSVRAPHVTLTIFSDGVSRLVTQIFFEGMDGNGADPVLAALPPELRGRLIARRAAGGTIDTYAIDIVMSGERETPLFDDILS